VPTGGKLTVQAKPELQSVADLLSFEFLASCCLPCEGTGNAESPADEAGHRRCGSVCGRC
jgi:hypothetical protein